MPIINLKSERLCPEGFLADYLEYTKNQESPEDYHVWVGIGVIAACLGRNCWVDRGRYKLFPNLYIVLVGESALTRKSTALGIGRNLLSEMEEEFAFFSQKLSPEALIHFLSERYKKLKRSEGVIFVPEFSTFLGKSNIDPSLLQILTDYYDSPEKRSYATLSRGIEVVNQVCLNMLAGTTEDWLKTSLPEESIGGGFLSRLLLVSRERSEKRIPFPEDFTQGLSTIRDRCICDLRTVRMMSGEFSWTLEAKEIFSTWYNELYSPEDAPPYLRGYMGRKGDTIIKLSMVFSAQRDSTRKIQERDITAAINLLNENEGYFKDVVDRLGQTDVGKEIERVLNLIKRNGEIDHSVLLTRVSNRMRAFDLKQLIETLIETGQIGRRLKGAKKVCYYFIGGKHG